MESLEFTDKMIEDHITGIEKSLKSLQKEKSYPGRQRKIRLLKNELDTLWTEINMFEQNLCSATEKQRNKFSPRLNDFTRTADRIKADMRAIEEKDSMKHDVEANILIDDKTIQRNQPRPVHQMQREELIKDIDGRLDEADQDMDEIINDLMKGKSLMEEINIEVKRQQEKISKAQEDIKETYSLSKRSKKLVNYFRKQIMTDKIIMTFVILIIIAILVIIILYALGFTKDAFDDNEEVKN